jgi:hypothetical protein
MSRDSPYAFLAAAKDSDRCIAVLPAVAIGTDMDAAPEQGGDAFNRRELVDDASGHQQSPCLQLYAITRDGAEMVVSPLERFHPGGQRRDRLASCKLTARLCEQP